MVPVVLIPALPPPGKPHLLPAESKEKPAGSIDSYLKSANSWLAEKKDIAERLLKNTSAKTENVKGFFGLEIKPKGPQPGGASECAPCAPLPDHGCDREAAPWPGDQSISASLAVAGALEPLWEARLLPCPPEFSTSQF